MRTKLRGLGVLLGALALAAVLVAPSEAGQRKYEGVTLRVMLPDGWTEAKPVSDLLIEAGKILGADVKISW